MKRKCSGPYLDVDCVGRLTGDAVEVLNPYAESSELLLPLLLALWLEDLIKEVTSPDFLVCLLGGGFEPPSSSAAWPSCPFLYGLMLFPIVSYLFSVEHEDKEAG